MTTDGTVDFFCCPRFDSPSVFASLLDAERGGYFSIKPVADGYVTRQLYQPDTAMLITRFMTPDGVGEVLDFMPVIEGKPTDRHRLVRVLRVARGTMRFEMEIQPRFDYGRASHSIEPTGAPVAAATFGLPEQAGGERNWDYRFTWVRDGSLTMHALANLGYLEEAARFATWIRDRVTEQVGEASGPLKIMYRVDGTSDLTEETLDHFEGWRGSKPVRIGNGAADQLQLDIYGEAMDALYVGSEYGLPIALRGWQSLTQIIDWVADHWDQPDEGIWETRGGRQDFTYGRFQCWVALDRAIRMAQRTGRPANIAKWAVERDRVYEQITARGWNEKIGAFTQRYGSDVLDSALLLMPLEGFIAPQDPMWLSTLRAIDGELVSDSLVYRYNPAASPDGLHGDEGTFSLCTFLYVDALAQAGQLDEAVLTFEKMQTYGNHLGLYSEEIGPTGEQLGNFPQAFTHLSLINAAITLNRELDRRTGHAERITAIAHLAGAV